MTIPNTMAEATEALTHWGGSRDAPIALQQRENAVYRVQLPDGPAALRLHRVGYQTAHAIGSELWWCAALARAGLPVPRPLPARDGALVVRLASGRLASAVGWLAGEAMGQAGTPLAGDLPTQSRLMRDLGGLIARMHTATDALHLPGTFTRPNWDIAGLVGEAPLWGPFWQHPALTTTEAAILRKARAWLARSLTRATDTGLIHADVLRENVLVSPAGLSLIDFDDAGFGYRLYDLGTALSQTLDEIHHDALCDAMIDGYARHRTVPVDVTAQVQAFTLMRACASVGWLAGRTTPDHPRTRPYIDRAITLARRLGAA